MSLTIYTLVGHFDPRRVHKRDLSVARPLDKERLDTLLAELPAGVTGLVHARGGYLQLRWAQGGWPVLPRAVRDLARRLASEEGCIVVENGLRVTYPPEAYRAQQEALEAEGIA